jgi:CBS domain-containing protein
MRVTQIMSKAVVTCRPGETLAAAAKLMWDRDIGCLPVIDDQGHVVGIVTDRDACMAAYTRGQPLQAIPVEAAMAHQVQTCGADDDVADVEKRMASGQIRRMPVIDDQGHPIGVVSMNDLARAAAQKAGPSASEIASTLAAICAPRQGVIATAA